MKNFVDIIMAFSGAAAFSRAIGVREVHGQKMKDRRSIPPMYWPAVIAAAKRRDIPITLETLAKAAVRADAARKEARAA